MTHPAPNSELTPESVKLLKAGDVLRHSDGRTGFYQSGTVGITVRSVYNGQWVFWPIEDPVTFIGRPDHEGWMPHDGGPNPVPGCRVDVRLRDGTERSGASENFSVLCDWWRHEGRSISHIIAFRLAEPSVERAGDDDDFDPNATPLDEAARIAEASERGYLAEPADPSPKPDVAGARERLLADLRKAVPYQGRSNQAFLCHAAADEIQRQGEEIERLRGAIDAFCLDFIMAHDASPEGSHLRLEAFRSSVRELASFATSRARQGGPDHG